MIKPVSSALISVYYKDGLEAVARKLNSEGCKIYSTGGTRSFLESLGIPVLAVEDLTGYPSILGGRVKTLHPKVFGGILARPEKAGDVQELKEFGIPLFDLVMVDLYPFEETLQAGAGEEAIIEKIDIGGVSLLRAAAKNHAHTLVISGPEQYSGLIQLLNRGGSSPEERRAYAAEAFAVCSRYDSLIYSHLAGDGAAHFRAAADNARFLRYGENPHQQGVFYGKLDEIFKIHNGKALSYNNLADADNALRALSEFNEPSCVIVKHTNSCGLASAKTLAEAYRLALQGDPVSAFGGVIAVNEVVDEETARAMHSLFFEILLAPAYTQAALELLKEKKNRILVECLKPYPDYAPAKEFKPVLNGVLVQDRDPAGTDESAWKVVTDQKPDAGETSDLVFALKAVKHLKSNAIALVKNKQLLGMGCGMTSRIDALRQAVEKARQAGLDIRAAVMASEAFFPFSDTVEAAHAAGISCIIQPGGSLRDQDSIDAANRNGQKMVFSGKRHFRH